MTAWVRVADAGAVPDEGTLRVDVSGVPVCLARSEGELFAVHDTCTHAEVSLSEGEVEGCLVECWLHGSQFDLRTGEPTGLPATTPVATYAVMVSGGGVFVDLSSRPERSSGHIPERHQQDPAAPAASAGSVKEKLT